MNTSIWHWFPLWLFAAMSVVFAVNGYMIYDAYRTFPGVAGTDGFNLSNEYTHVLAVARQQAALGWQIETGLTDERFPVLRLTDRAAAPLTAAAIEAHAERPVGPADATALTFHGFGDGRYQADTSLSSGQWDIMLTVVVKGQEYNATRRVVVK